MPRIIDCYIAEDVDRTLLDLGTSETEGDIIINCGDSSLNPREYITIETEGNVTLNKDKRPVKIGERVVMSFEEGKVTNGQYLDRDYLHSRHIGKVIKIIDENTVRVLLDIE